MCLRCCGDYFRRFAAVRVLQVLVSAELVQFVFWPGCRPGQGAVLGVLQELR